MKFKLLNMSVDAYLQNPPNVNRESIRRHVDANGAWIDERLDEHAADFIAYGTNSGRVYLHGSMQDSPSEDDSMKLGGQHGELVLPVSRETPIEEVIPSCRDGTRLPDWI